MNFVGSQVKAIREQQNLTQEQLTAKCQLVGFQVSCGTLAKIEAQIGSGKPHEQLNALSDMPTNIWLLPIAFRSSMDSESVLQMGLFTGAEQPTTTVKTKMDRKCFMQKPHHC